MKNLFFILITLLLVGCGRTTDTELDNSPKLPPESQTGANTFGCLVNGKLFYPRDGMPGFGVTPKGLIIVGDPSGSQNYIEIEADNFKDGKPINNFTMHLQNLNTIGLGNYALKQTNFKYGIDGIMDNYFLIRAFDYSEGIWKWYGSYDNSGSVTITKYDKTNYIISGIFSGKVKTEDGKSELEITNGRFDINKSTIKNTNFP